MTNMISSQLFKKLTRIFPAKDLIPTKYEYSPQHIIQIHQILSESIFAQEQKNHNIDLNKYSTVYITSDIHADVRRFLDVLIREEIITIRENFNPFNDDIYDTTIIEQIQFNKKNTLLLILGDLIHGKRERNSVDDKIGNFELLLHVILFNLRIKARDNNSEILFTLGNHDYHHLFNKNSLLKYSHSVDYFKNNKIDSIILFKQALIPFYSLSPYIMLNLKYNGTIEFSCIHTGFHNYKVDITKSIEDIQNIINEGGIEKLTTKDINITALYTKINENDIGGLWTRSYAEDKIQCSDLSTHPTIVVGHCPTQTEWEFNRIDKILTTNLANLPDESKPAHIINYDKCNDSHGCVVVDCYDTPDKRPKLIFVDTMMSDAFRNIEDRKGATRNIELLMLEHTNSFLKDTNWITKISRKPAGDKAIPVWGGGEILPPFHHRSNSLVTSSRPSDKNNYELPPPRPSSNGNGNDNGNGIYAVAVEKLRYKPKLPSSSQLSHATSNIPNRKYQFVRSLRQSQTQHLPKNQTHQNEPEYSDIYETLKAVNNPKIITIHNDGTGGETGMSLQCMWISIRDYLNYHTGTNYTIRQVKEMAKWKDYYGINTILGTKTDNIPFDNKDAYMADALNALCKALCIYINIIDINGDGVINYETSYDPNNDKPKKQTYSNHDEECNNGESPNPVYIASFGFHFELITKIIGIDGTIKYELTKSDYYKLPTNTNEFNPRVLIKGKLVTINDTLESEEDKNLRTMIIKLTEINLNIHFFETDKYMQNQNISGVLNRFKQESLLLENIIGLIKNNQNLNYFNSKSQSSQDLIITKIYKNHLELKLKEQKKEGIPVFHDSDLNPIIDNYLLNNLI